MGNPTDSYNFKYYHEGFFGYSLTPVFEEFSFWHFLPIILLGVAIWLVYRYRKQIAAWKGEETLRFILGAVMILNESFYYWRLLYVGNGGAAQLDPMLTYLPLQVCEWSAYIAAFMLLKKSRHLFDICYYVCLTLGAIPLITPAVITYTGPTYARYYQFWIEHLLPIFAVFYMMFVHGFKANFRKIYKPFAMLSVLATLAIIANLNIENANFMYLAAGTAGDSLANILPQNIWIRLGLYLGILIVLFFLVSLPHIIPEIKEKRKAKKENASKNIPDTSNTD
jgi:hypothetical integral membrane protein (TIGR02206 family)